jgi:hypothetical protein
MAWGERAPDASYTVLIITVIWPMAGSNTDTDTDTQCKSQYRMIGMPWTFRLPVKDVSNWRPRDLASMRAAQLRGGSRGLRCHERNHITHHDNDAIGCNS